jgi:hypothetical protein
MQLSEKENQIIFDTEFLINKISVIAKIQTLFEEVRKSLVAAIISSDFVFPVSVDIDLGKIFKGENYQSLPYINLDFPKYFSNEDIFTCRTMFWWGNFFSSTLHLQGKSLELYRHNIINNLDKLINEEIYICINRSPWEYHYKSDNYILLSKFNIKKFNDLDFLKLSEKFNLADYNNLPKLSSDFLQRMLSILKF